MSAEMTECAYCLKDVPAQAEHEHAPDLHDDGAWAEEAKLHAPTCEWVATRAHQRDAA